MLQVRQGNVTVTLDDGLEKLARAAIENVLPGVLDEMTRLAAEVASDAHADWPVKTGKSAAGIRLVQELDLGRSSVAVRIRNDVSYAIYVKPAVWHGATTAWERLIRKPMADLHRELTERLGPQIVEALRRG